MAQARPDDPAVLVVGAGPVGLLLGCELARRRVPVRVIDRLERPTDESRAIVVHARSLEMLERVGVLDQIVAAAAKATAAELHADGRRVARIELDVVDSPFPFSALLPQTDTERILCARLEQLGTAIERGTELLGLEQADGAVTARLRGPDGREEAARSAFLVGTDGSHSAVRHALGARLEGSFEGETFLLGDVEAEHDLDRSAIHTFFSAAEGPLFVFAMLGDRTRVIAQLPADAGKGVEPTLASLQEVIDRRAGGILLRQAHWLTHFEIHHAQVPRYRYGRVFLAGDAAHVHSPAAGQGMNTGLQDAFNLGWKLALAADGRGGEALLDSYHAERHPVAERVIAQTTSLTRVGTLPHPPERALRNRLIHLAAGLAPLKRRLAEEVEETTISYAGSPIVAGEPPGGRAPGPGDAAPDVTGLGEGGVALRSLLGRGDGHALLEVHSGHVVVDEEATPDPDGRVAERYGARTLFAVRPDGYIGLRSAAGNRDAYTAYLRTLGAG